MSGQVLTIIHDPYGADLPYAARFEERRPRDPVGGDMVTIGILTRPGGAADTVRLEWRRNGRAQPPIVARPAMRGAEEDRRLVELGVLEGGEQIEYWITAERGEQRVTSACHAFTVRQRRRLAGISAVERVAGHIRLATIAGDSEPGPDLLIEATSGPGTLRLSAGPAAKRPGSPAAVPRALDASGPIEVVAGGLSLAVDADTGRLRLRPGGPHASAGQAVEMMLRWEEDGGGRLAALELAGSLDDDEALVGFGERFDALDQRGRSPDIFVYEQYKNQGNRTYLPVPFFLSSRGYGCLVEGTTYVAYDLGRTIADRWRCFIEVPASGMVTIDLFGGSPVEILHAFARVTGPVTLPPAWAFGPWMSSNEWNTQERVLAEVAQTEALGVPATVLVIEAWSDETTFYIWNGASYTARDGAAVFRLVDFTFPPDGPWPDPKGLIERLHEAGIRALLWQIPALKDAGAPHPQHDADVAHALARGYVIRDAEGQPFRNPGFWFHNALIPDFTSSEATDWWLGKRAYLVEELGIDGFKTDGGEHLAGRGLRASDGRRGNELVNAFPNLYAGAYQWFLRQRRGADTLTFSRAGHTGAGRYPAHWAGDENSTWDAFRRSLIAGLTAGLSGVPFWGWDLAGFSEALPSAELYLRAAAMAAFCPIMQYHSEYNPSGESRDRTPWNVARQTGDERVVPLYRFFARLRMNLLPYIVSEAAHAAATGEPLLRALLVDFPDDPEAWRIADQYLFGRSLLVAPVMEEGATTRRLYLPRGRWQDLWSGMTQEGGRWIETPAPLDRIPVFVRAGAVLPLNLGGFGAAGGLGDDVGNAVDTYTALNFWLYPAGRADYEWVDARGKRRWITMQQERDGTVRVDVPPLPVACALVIPGGPSVQVKPSPTARWVTLA